VKHAKYCTKVCPSATYKLFIYSCLSGEAYVSGTTQLVEVTTEDTAAAQEKGYATRSRSKMTDDMNSNSSNLSDKTDPQVYKYCERYSFKTFAQNLKFPYSSVLHSHKVLMK